MVEHLYMSEKERLIEWERLEEREEFNEACGVANKDLWVCDDGGV